METKDDKYIFARSEKAIRKIEISKIVYIEGKGDYISIVTSKSKRYIVHCSLKRIEIFLNNIQKNMFTRVHNSYVVSKNYIDKVEKDTVILDERCELLEHKTIPVGDHFRKRMRTQLNFIS